MQGAANLSRGAGGQPGKLELTEKAIARSACPVMSASASSAAACAIRFATVEGILPDRVAAGARPRSGRPDRPESEKASKAGSWTNASASASSGGSCGYCVYCRDGDLVNCTNQGYTGGSTMAATPR